MSFSLLHILAIKEKELLVPWDPLQWGSTVHKLMSTSTDSFVDTSVLLNPANAERIVDTLCRVRGAALKLGQVSILHARRTFKSSSNLCTVQLRITSYSFLFIRCCPSLTTTFFLLNCKRSSNACDNRRTSCHGSRRRHSTYLMITYQACRFDVIFTRVF